jgi:type IV secretory pathway protease TraF
MTPEAGSRETADQMRRANARFVARLLAACGTVLTIAALVALAGWLPFSAPASRALTIVLALTGAVDLIVAFVFVTRSRP